jgi:hypothetical protein
MPLPTVILEMLENRPDLCRLGLKSNKNERVLVRWIINHGFIEYKQDWLIDNRKNNELFEWLTDPISNNGIEKLPRVVLGIWDSNKLHRRLWPDPSIDNFYTYWVIKNLEKDTSKDS